MPLRRLQYTIRVVIGNVETGLARLFKQRLLRLTAELKEKVRKEALEQGIKRGKVQGGEEGKIKAQLEIAANFYKKELSCLLLHVQQVYQLNKLPYNQKQK